MKHNPAFVQLISLGASLLNEPIAKQTAAATSAAALYMIYFLSHIYQKSGCAGFCCMPVSLVVCVLCNFLKACYFY
jgi:hypothetical protein